MSSRNVYHNWEKLVVAVIKREKDYLLARCDSIISTSSSDVFSQRFSSDSNGLWPIQFSEIKKATRNFRPDAVIGEMTFPRHFRGWFHEDSFTAAKSGTGICLAVELNPCSMHEQKEWLDELNYLSQFHHPNVLKAIGYCSVDDQLILVHEFIQRRSLDLHLFRRYDDAMPWATRIKVAVGAARALSFFHDREVQVLHRDFKTGNILLDGEFNAKLSEFVLDGSVRCAAQVSTLTRVSDGYVAPEYFVTGKLTKKCNVYGFGVVLLELLTGCRVIEKNRPAKEQNLVDWAKPVLLDKRKFLRIMDSRLKDQYPGKAAYAVGKLAFKCLNPKPELRPQMSKVLFALEHL